MVRWWLTCFFLLMLAILGDTYGYGHPKIVLLILAMSNLAFFLATYFLSDRHISDEPPLVLCLTQVVKLPFLVRICIYPTLGEIPTNQPVQWNLIGTYFFPAGSCDVSHLCPFSL